MKQYRFLSPAAAEAAAAAQYYDDHSPGLGAEFVADLDDALLRIRAFPEAGATYEEDSRRALFHRFPFELIYRVEADAVVVIAVAHQRRRPGYWKSR